MAKATLPVNFKDDVMNASMQNKRRYRVINNPDGTISLEDVTTYDQVGSNFGQAQINATNTAVNESADKNKIIDSLDDIAANTQSGMIAGALALAELNRNSIVETGSNSNGNYRKYADGTLEMWGSLSLTGIKITSHSGVLYNSVSQGVNFPVSSLTVPIVNVDFASAGGVFPVLGYISTLKFLYWLYADISQARSGTLSWNAKGTWK